jgi:hypothetical protein
MRRRMNGPKITGSDRFARGCLFAIAISLILWPLIFLLWWLA